MKVVCEVPAVLTEWHNLCRSADNTEWVFWGMNIIFFFFFPRNKTLGNTGALKNVISSVWTSSQMIWSPHKNSTALVKTMSHWSARHCLHSSRRSSDSVMSALHLFPARDHREAENMLHVPGVSLLYQ